MKFQLIIDKQQPEQITAVVHRRNDLTDQIEQLILSHTGQDAVAAFSENEMRMLPYHQIECFTVIDGKTFAIDTKGTRYRIKLRLYELEQTVPSSFFRINKSTLANEPGIERFTSTYAGAINARFKSGYEDYVSRRCFAAIKRRFDAK